jgi:excisionase family DNA binding protein
MTMIQARVSGRPPLYGVRRRGAHRGLGAARPLPNGHWPGTDALLTADEVAALLRMTKAWVYAETRAQRIPHVPLGRCVRYRKSAVLAWITELERQSRGASPARIGGGIGQ